MSIQVTSLSKNYGEQKAVNDISFSARKGQIIGFLGPNGAGKSTTMKMLTGFLKPTEGEIKINDIDVIANPISAQKTIGYLPEHNPLYLEMYVREYLQFQASIFKVDKSQIESVIEKVGLTLEASKKISQLSKGYRQRIGLAAAIIHNPDVLILDEPTTGLDPNQLVEIRELIKELGKEKTVLLSTHIMQEVEAMCDSVIIVDKGEIVINKPLSELKNQKEQVLNVMFDYKIEEQFLQRLPNVKTIKNNFDNSWLLTFSSDEDMRPKIFDFAQEHELKILELNSENKNLEKLFRELTN
ncbi:gliding motility-associated ABC transporter ATP-binding subunit GldA [Tenacibaculum todarodis]|uniref:Gliding motility-associated ABC transporter ATP-binding subunit GldA n=1 Tax=Tenacibaculum todarodis TaxID=1850252 RepID=A0A1L3JJI9_9FLAO|nr:gliding motility-associated ABC transporter ATP-binding subunit GldA [Tenacibaculum todarodis]APG65310.1 gliding motility-associated ABC transporter ATP-binding subunit GldA [Tenacibaculum todarodis]